MSGWDDISSDNKTCTSYEQNSEHNKKADGACDRYINTNVSDENGIDDRGVGNTADDINNNVNDHGVDNEKFNAVSNGDNIDLVSDILGRLDISEDDKLLFQDPPPKLDCPICFLPMPYSKEICGVTTSYMSCCGKMVCGGCLVASFDEMRKGTIKDLCAFCRVPVHRTNKEFVKRLKKRMKLNDATAFYLMGTNYNKGVCGLPKDMKKALELWKQSTDMGSNTAHSSLAGAYFLGEGVEKDQEKGMYHLRLAAIGGHEISRHMLGSIEANRGIMDRAMKHYMIAARCGYEDSLKKVGEGYKAGHVTKDEYASALRAYQVCCDEMKSEQRARAREEDKYVRMYRMPNAKKGPRD